MSGAAPDGAASARSSTLLLATRGPLFDCYAALTARLELAFPAQQFRRVAVPAKPSRQTWDRLLTTLPFVGLCWLGLAPQRDTGTTFRCSADWLVYLACKNPRPELLLAGDPYGVGQLGLASLGAALLHGWSVPDLGTWRVAGVDNAAPQEMVGEEVGLVALQVGCTLSLVDAAAAAALPEFLRVGAQWDLPPIGGMTVEDVRPI